MMKISPNHHHAGYRDNGNIQSQDNHRKEELENKVHLKREMGLVGAVSVIVGIMIGSGIYVSPRGIVAGSGSVGMSLLTWLMGGLLSLCGGLAYVELGTMIPKSGGDYSYLLEGLPPIFAFTYAFLGVVLLRTSSLPITSLTCAHYALSLFYNDGCGKASDYEVKSLAVIIICLLSALNAYSAKLANRIQIVFTIAKLLTLGIIILGGIYNVMSGIHKPLQSGFKDTNTNIGEIALGFYSSMWAFDGWSNLNFLVEELQEPKKNLPRAIIIGVTLVTVMYILTNISYFTVLTPEDILKSNTVALSWAQIVMPTLAWTIPVFVILSTFGSTNGCIITTGRFIYVAGREGHLIKILSMIDVQRYTPSPAIYFTALGGILFTLPTNIDALIEIYSFVAWICFGVVFAMVIYLRWKWPDRARPFKCPLLFVILSLISAIYLVLAPVLQSPTLELLYSFIFVLAGVLLYVPFIHYKWSLPGMGKLTTVMQMLLQVSPTDPEAMEAILEGDI